MLTLVYSLTFLISTNQAGQNEKYYQNMSCKFHTEHPKEHRYSLVIAPTLAPFLYLKTL